MKSIHPENRKERDSNYPEDEDMRTITYIYGIIIGLVILIACYKFIAHYLAGSS